MAFTEQDYQANLQNIREALAAQHAEELARLQFNHETEIAQLRAAMRKSEGEHATELLTMRTAHEKEAARIAAERDEYGQQLAAANKELAEAIKAKDAAMALAESRDVARQQAEDNLAQLIEQAGGSEVVEAFRKQRRRAELLAVQDAVARELLTLE